MHGIPGLQKKRREIFIFVYIWEEQMRRMFPVSLKKNHIELMDVRGISPFISSVFLCVKFCIDFLEKDSEIHMTETIF